MSYDSVYYVYSIRDGIVEIDSRHIIKLLNNPLHIIEYYFDNSELCIDGY